MDYVELIFKIDPPGQAAYEILMAKLSMLEYESFVETDESLKAYIEGNKYSEKKVIQIINELSEELGTISFEYNDIQQQNWNEEWEKNFEPIVIAEKCIVRAPFHEKFPQFEYNILIEPKMAFGTGHHATTSMMLEHLLSIDLEEKKVLDMGSGTGVLAILASLRGADLIFAVDNDTWAYNNCLENLQLNNVENVYAVEGDVSAVKDEFFDVILANINRNTLINDIKKYNEILKSDGLLIMSGFYVDDIPSIEQAANEQDLFLKKYFEKNNWASVVFSEK